MIQCEMETRSISREEVIAGMEKNLVVMEQAVERGIRGSEITNWFNWWRCCKKFRRI